MKRLTVQRILSIPFWLAALGIGIWGRLVYFHNTEMETLFYGWRYWVPAAACAIIAIFLYGDPER